MSGYLHALQERVVVFDGAAGTTLQQAGLAADDFGGPDLEGCNEILNVTRPDVITTMHDEFLSVGVDVIETNTFGAFAVPLGEYGIADRAYDLNRAAAELAVSVARDHSTKDHPRWVAGSIGPGTRLPTLGQITYAELVGAYEVQAAGLLAGGCDLLIIETMYDLLTLKAAVAAGRRAMRAAGRSVPLQTQVTIETSGRMLPGTEIAAALAAVEPLRIDVFGLNCATGPDEMEEHLRYLSRHAGVAIAAIPNAGLPEVVAGEMHYGLTPQQLAEQHARFITELGVNVVGGCCGTTPAHLGAVVERCRNLVPARRHPRSQPGAASTYSFVPFAQDTSFLIIGERTNANGSKKFREAMLAEDWEACVAVGRSQVAESAHLVDLCVDYVGRDGATDMDELAQRFATQVVAPVVLDSTEPAVMRTGLERIGGRAVLNSANLEDGDGPGSRAEQVFQLAVEHGAAVICLLIDEEGQARNVEWKMRVAHRLYDLAVNRHGLAPADLLFDALTFPLTTGDPDLRGDAVATIETIRRIKDELPGVATVLGVSNVSFGLRPAARHVLNSMFLHECLAAGLDAAIIHAGRIVPLHQIDDHLRQLCLDLIYDRGGDDYDPLTELVEQFSDVQAAAPVAAVRADWPVTQRLERRIVDGDMTGIEDDLAAAIESGHLPLDIINGPLLAGMKTVGDLFAGGEMQLPFVLRSAETMKKAVAYLEPRMDRSDVGRRGSIVLATVRGDVHDIGKNLVDIILTNNGFDVHNLGIKVGIAEILDAFAEHQADAIGMSGLLVKSTLVMRDNLEEMKRRGLESVPVILGGAALTRSYVERDLRAVYPGPLFYGKDAFAGLAVMEGIAARRRGERDDSFGRVETRSLPPLGDGARAAADGPPPRSPEVATDNPVFRPPFLGARTIRGVALDEIADYINETALYRNQWQYRPRAGESDTEFKGRLRTVFREQLAGARAADLLVPQVVYGFYPVNSVGNELIVWEDDLRSAERMRFAFPRQSEPPWLCIADFFRPVASGELDYAAFHVVTMGERISQHAAALFAADRYRDYLHIHGLGVEMTEALAELWHQRIRTEWGFGEEDGPSLQGLFRQQYRGGRYSWGYPACPDLEDNVKVAALLDAERIGVVVGEDTGYQFHPEQTTSALICHHPRAKYFVARERVKS
jgi:5-methyltetrahydrofolate--homocysteine methyltransferase